MKLSFGTIKVEIQNFPMSLCQPIVSLKPSLSMKILSINDFTTKLLSKLLSDLYTGVHLKGTKKFGSKLINRQFFHRKTFFIRKSCLLLTLLTNILVSKTTF